MQQLFFADIFFLVTTISVVLVAATAAAFLMYAALIARDIRKISKKLKKESIACIDDIVTVKKYMFSERERVMDLMFLASDVIREFTAPRKAPARKKAPSRKKAASRKRATKVTVKEEK